MMFIPRPEILDDRGQAVRVVNGVWFAFAQWTRRPRDPRLSAAAAKIRKPWTTPLVKGIRTHNMTAQLGCLVMVPVALGIMVAAGVGVMILLMPLFLLAFALVIGIYEGRTSGMATDVVGHLLEAGRCPCCLFPVDALKPEDDGRVVCPECGAAWNNGRVERRGT